MEAHQRTTGFPMSVMRLMSVFIVLTAAMPLLSSVDGVVCGHDPIADMQPVLAPVTRMKSWLLWPDMGMGLGLGRDGTW